MLAGARSGYIPLAALPGRLAFMTLGADELELYFAKHPSKYEVRGAAVRDASNPLACAGDMLGRHAGRPGPRYTGRRRGHGQSRRCKVCCCLSS